MKYRFRLFLALFLGGYVSAAQAQPDVGLRARAEAGDCEPGEAEAVLDANNVSARLFNTGTLFWRGDGFQYRVPKEGQANALFAQSLWIGGTVAGEMRFAGTLFGPFEYGPGPLDEAGNPPNDCATYDRIYKVSRSDIERYEQTGEAAPDLAGWPAELGAPVADGDGEPGNYDLAGGDRPEMRGDQTLWWVMNDAAGPHRFSEGDEPLHMEVQVTAYALGAGDALGNTTFYRYKLLYRGEEPLEETYVGLFTDPDVGNGSDDFLGSDTTLHVGYAYNGDDFDDGFDGYGDRPPAVGVVVLEGPLADGDGADNDRDGQVDEAGERLGMTNFLSNWKWLRPRVPYNSLRSLWPDGTPLRYGGADGIGGEWPVTRYSFPGDPVERAFWSEENTDGEGTRNVPSDRYLVVSSGPFTMRPGDVQEVTYAIVWSQGRDRLHSVTRLKEDVRLVRSFFSGRYAPAPVPAAPSASPTLVAPAEGAVVQPDSTFDPDLTFEWNPAGENLYYRLQLAADPSFSELARDRFVPGLDQTRQPLHLVSGDQRYYWRVRAENAGGAGPWSEVRSFLTSEAPPPQAFALQGNYPNPFNDATTFVFSLPALADVRVEVYDLLGRRVLAVSERAMLPGEGRELRLEAPALGSGLYLYRITARSPEQAWQKSGRMVVVRGACRKR